MNKYEIKGIVGEGAYGIVYQARHKETGEIGKWHLSVGNTLICTGFCVAQLKWEVFTENGSVCGYSYC